MRIAVAAMLAAILATAAQAEAIKIGILKTTGSGPIFIAQDKGYFAAENLQSELVMFESAQPIAVATVSGDVDFGYTGFTGGFYGLASQGVLRIIAGGTHEIPGFDYQPILVSNKAHAAGLTAFKDFPGHAFGVSQIGSPPHYALGLVAQKYGFDIKSMRVVPLQTIPNLVSAITSGQVDATMMPGNVGVPVIQKGDAKLMGYVGDEAPYQLVGVLVSRQTADTRGDTIARFLRALKKGSRAYYDAFTAGGKRSDGPTAPEMAAILAKGAGQSVAEVTRSLPYIDPDARLDIADVARQYAWYRDQGLVKGGTDVEAMIDRRYVEDWKK